MQNVIKPLKPIFVPYKGRKLCSLTIPENKAGELQINVKEPDDKYGNGFITELKNKYNKLLGFEHYSHEFSSDKITGLYIDVEPEYRRKNYRFGEILRLVSIMEMLENKINKFVICAKDNAIYFHAKYKFEPAVTSFSTRDKLLETVINDNSKKFSDLSGEAAQLKEKISSALSAEEQRNLCSETNLLLSRYIRRAELENNINKHQFNWPMDMVLTSEQIYKNKNYFNRLFKKHGIDYSI